MSRYKYSNRFSDMHGRENLARVNCRFNRYNPRPDTRLYKFEEIPEFWGNKYSNPIVEWVSLLDKYFDYYGFLDYDKVERCRAKLTGGAALFVDLRELKKPISCWSELKNMLLEKYSLTKDPSTSPPPKESSIDPPVNSKRPNRVDSPLNKIIESSPLPIALPLPTANDILATTHNLFCEIHGKMRINIDIDKIAVEIHLMLHDFNVGNEMWVRMPLCSRSLFNADLFSPPVRESPPKHPLLITLPSWEHLKAKFEAITISFPIQLPLQKIVPTGPADNLGNGILPVQPSHGGCTIQKLEDSMPPPSPTWRTLKKMIAKVVQDVGVPMDCESFVVPPPPPWPPWEDKPTLSLHHLICLFRFTTEDGWYKYLVHWQGKPKAMLCIDRSSSQDSTMWRAMQCKQFDPGGRPILPSFTRR